MTVDLNVLDPLADGLYSSVSAVITETVANAWDADAGSVHITIDVEHDFIKIEDDGVGMDLEAINDRYLKVGYHRRFEGDLTSEGRPVMGRKGIGKLSLFSIADLVQLYTKRRDSKTLGLEINRLQLMRELQDGAKEYNPVSISPPSDFSLENGTRIVASQLREKRLKDINPQSLRRRLARRFSVIGNHGEGKPGEEGFTRGFRVFVNDEEVTTADREDLKFVEYLWVFGDSQVNTEQCSEEPRRTKLVNHGDPLMEGETVNGWIGTVDKPKRLVTNEGSLNSIVILARGRLVDEDILSRIESAEVYTKYLTGQIEADFLDDSGQDDIVTSNRQRMIEDDERFERLTSFLRKSLRKIGEEWNSLRTKDKTRALRDLYPRIGEWLDSLPKGWKDKAEKLLGRIATLEIGEEEDLKEGNRQDLLRHAIFGFERLRLRGDAEELEKALEEGIDKLLRLLADKDSLEASFYLDIVKNRLEVVKHLASLVDEDQKERVLQEYLFEHLWLLDPAWERATGSESMEERLRLRECFKDDEVTKKRYGRVDIRYRAIAGKHIIVELKRASVKKSIYELAEQGSKYVEALQEIVGTQESIEVVFVVGKTPKGSHDAIVHAMMSVSPGSVIRTYDTLIRQATAAYEEFLEEAKKADKIEHLLDPIIESQLQV